MSDKCVLSHLAVRAPTDKAKYPHPVQQGLFFISQEKPNKDALAVLQHSHHPTHNTSHHHLNLSLYFIIEIWWDHQRRIWKDGEGSWEKRPRTVSCRLFRYGRIEWVLDNIGEMADMQIRHHQAASVSRYLYFFFLSLFSSFFLLSSFISFLGTFSLSFPFCRSFVSFCFQI